MQDFRGREVFCDVFLGCIANQAHFSWDLNNAQASASVQETDVPHWHVSCQPAGLSKHKNDAVLNERGKLSWYKILLQCCTYRYALIAAKQFSYRSVYKLYW